MDRFGDSLPDIVNVQTMDGEIFPIKFLAVEGCFYDMHALLSKLLPKQCQFFYFKFVGGPNFQVLLLDGKYDLHVKLGV